RRHTRWPRDWSSDVCSSDLLWLARMDGATPANSEIAIAKGRSAAVSRRTTKNWEDRIAAGRTALLNMPVLPVQGGVPIMVSGERSEERRVGKEGRARWAGEH